MGLPTVLNQIAVELSPVSAASRVLYRTAAAWLLIGVLHVAPLAADGWNWDGAVSFRKPIVFSFSIGLLLATIGWVIDWIPIRGRFASVLAWTLAVSSSVEVALVSVQTWRGRASHFNRLEPSDATIFGLMGAAVGIMSLCIVVVFAWSLVKTNPDRLVRIAVVSGLALVVTGLGIGQWMIQLGVEYVERFNMVPDTVTVGAAGVAKFPHALALHGVQLFILYALLLRAGRSHLGNVARMYTMVGLYIGVLALVVLQTVSGYAPTQATPYLVGIALGSIAMAWNFMSTLRTRIHELAVGDENQPVDMLSG